MTQIKNVGHIFRYRSILLQSFVFFVTKTGGSKGASKLLYDRDTELQPASEEMEQLRKDGKIYKYWLVNIPGYR